MKRMSRRSKINESRTKLFGKSRRNRSMRKMLIKELIKCKTKNSSTKWESTQAMSTISTKTRRSRGRLDSREMLARWLKISGRNNKKMSQVATRG